MTARTVNKTAVCGAEAAAAPVKSIFVEECAFGATPRPALQDSGSRSPRYEWQGECNLVTHALHMPPWHGNKKILLTLVGRSDLVSNYRSLARMMSGSSLGHNIGGERGS